MRDFDKLLNFAEENSVPVKFARLKGFARAAYDIMDNEVILNMDFDKNDAKSVYVLAHELGHYIDFKNRGSKYVTAQIAAATIMEYCMDSEMQVPPVVAETIRSSEKRAFVRGEELLEKLGIMYPKSLLKQWKREELADYREIFRGKIKWSKYTQ